jgi:hypothetical protein
MQPGYGFTGKTEEEHRADPMRVAGTVGCAPFGADADALPGEYHWFVECDGFRYQMRNALSHNPFRGLGSQSQSYYYGKDDVDKKEPFMNWLGMDDNTTNTDYLGTTIVPSGASVTFVPKATETLMTEPDTGDVAMFTSTGYPDKGYCWPVAVDATCLGIACNVAIDKSKPLPRGYIPWAPVL